MKKGPYFDISKKVKINEDRDPHSIQIPHQKSPLIFFKIKSGDLKKNSRQQSSLLFRF